MADPFSTLLPEPSGDATLLVDGDGIVPHGRRPGADVPLVVEASASRATLLAALGRWSRGLCVALVDARLPAARAKSVRARLGSCRALSDGVGEFALALCTSGSSGDPKIAVHRPASLVAAARAANARVPFGPGDRWLLSLAPHHIGGVAILVRALVGGGAVRIGGGATEVARDLIADPEVTHVSVVASQLRRLLDDARAVERMRSMRAVVLGGGPAPATWRHEAVARGVPLFASYGMTETASQMATGRATQSDEAGDAGSALDGVEIRTGATGEIEVRGPILFAGYVREGQVRDARGADGWFATGDVGAIDSRGHVLVLGRRDAMFISGGENIHPEEIENALREVRGVTHACVVAIDDARWQKRPVAFVAGAFEARDLEDTLTRRLERFRWPDRIHPMPNDLLGQAKVNRPDLALRAANAPTLWSR